MPPTRTRRPAPERRRQIAAAMLDILAAGGARDLTTQRIADAVGVTDAALFRHFPDKDAMVSEAIDLFVARMSSSFPEDAAEPLPALREFFSRRLAMVSQYPEMMRLAFNDRLAEVAGIDGARTVSEMVERSVGFIRDCLLRARRKGEISQDVSVDVLVWTVTGVLRGAAGARGGGASTTQLSPEEVWTALERLLRAEPTTSRAARKFVKKK